MKKRFCKIFFSMLLCAALLLTVTACAASAPPSQAEPSTPEGEAAAANPSGKIVIWTWTADQLKPSIIPAFNEAYPDVEVELVNLPAGELKTKLLACLAAGTGAPDVCQVQGDDSVQFIVGGGLGDLSGYLGETKNDFPAFQMANNTDADGKIYAVPIDAGPCGLYYREDLFTQAGISAPPKTWDEFFAAGEALKKIGVSLHRMPKTGDPELLRMFVQQQGGTYFDAEGKPTLDTPEFRSAVELQIKMYESGNTMDVKNWSPAYDAEMQGDKLATHLGAAWYMNTFTNQWPEAKNTWKIAAMPQFEAGADASCNNGGSGMAIPEQSENKDAAWAFINFFCASDEGRLIATKDMGELASYLPVFETQEMKDKTVKFFGDQKVFSFFKEELKKIPTEFKITAAFPELADAIESQLGKAVTQEVTIDAFVAEMQATAEAIAAKY